MSITINDTPQLITPVYNEVPYILSSDNDTEDNFKIQVVVYDSTDNNNQETIGTFLYPISPNGYAKTELTRILRDSVTHDFALGDKQIVNCPNSIKRFYVTAQEFYGNPPSVSGTIIDLNDYTNASGTLICWNASLPFEEFQPYNYTNYILTQANYTSNRYLTNADLATGINMSSSQNGYVYLAQRGYNTAGTVGDLIDKMTIKTYDSSDNLLGTWTVALDYTFAYSTLTGYMVKIPVGTYNLGLIDTLDFISGTQPIITASTAYYKVYPSHATYGDCYPIRVNITEYCNSPQVFRLHFLNRLGGFDSFNFEQYYTQNVNIERKLYKSNIGSYDSGTYTTNLSDRQSKTLVNTAKRQYNIVSNWISEDEASWLEELLTSPVVYWEVDSTTLYGINILTSNYEVKYSHKDKVFNIELQFEVNFDYNSQTY